MIKEIAIIKRILRKKITYYDHNNLLLLSYFKIYFYMSNFASIGRFDLVKKYCFYMSKTKVTRH